jgi:Ca2+-binding EF-hand superfamily protein
MAESVESILARIKEFGQSRGLDFESEILAYDRKRKGVISAVSLHRWIGTMGFNLGNCNIQALTLAYQRDDGIDALRLIADLKQSQTFKETISAQPTGCQAELADLARDLAARGQTLRELLAPYDRPNAGRVSPTNFYRVLGASPSVRAIAEAYVIGGEVDYFRIQADLRPVTKAIRQAGEAAVPDVTPGFAALATLIKAQDADARQVFSQKDPLNTGKLPPVQFESLLSFFDAGLSPAAIGEIARPFIGADGLANYFLFLRALDQFVPPPPKGPPRATEVLPEQVTRSQDPNYLLAKARQVIEERRIDLDLHFSSLTREGAGDQIPLGRFVRVIQGMRIGFQDAEIKAVASLFPGDFGAVRWQDFQAAVTPSLATREVTASSVVSRLKTFLAGSFASLASSARRFDREKSGVISAPQFASALQFLRFDFTNQDLAAIRDAYPGPTRGTIDWPTLCSEVDRPAPTPTTQTLDIPVGTALPPESIAAIVTRLESAAQLNKIDLLTEFQALDRTRQGFLSQEDFIALVNDLPTELKLPEVRALTSYYRISGRPDINYIALCRDAKAIANPPTALPPPPTTTVTPTVQFAPASVPPAVHDFIKRYKAFCSQRRIVPGDVFLPYDAAHSGLIPIVRVQACFNNVDFPVLRSDVEQVIATFRDEKRSDQFNYIAFNRVVTAEDITSQEVRASLASTPVSADLERTAAIVALQIREKLLARHRRIDMAFRGVTTDTISATEFQKRLAAMDLVLLPGQTNALLRRYRVNLTDEINWKAFVSDVEQSKTIGTL